MRRAAIAVLITAAAMRAPAAERQLTIFMSDLTRASTIAPRSDWGFAAGLGLAYGWSPRWQAALEVSAQRYPQTYARWENIAGTYAPVMRMGRYTSWPVDLLTRYSFANESRWTPIVGAGLHYVRAPVARPDGALVVPEPVLTRRLSAELVGGVAFRTSRRTSVNAELKRLVRSNGVKWHDPLTRGSIGVTWHY